MYIDKIDEDGNAWVRSFHFPCGSFRVGGGVMIPETKMDIDYLNEQSQLAEGVIHSYSAADHLFSMNPSSVRAEDIVTVRCHIPKGAYYWGEMGPYECVSGLYASTELVLDYLAIDLQPF